MVNQTAFLSASPVTAQPDNLGGLSDEGGTVVKESPEKAPFLEVKIPQPGQKEPTHQTAEEFARIGKRLKSERIKP